MEMRCRKCMAIIDSPKECDICKACKRKKTIKLIGLSVTSMIMTCAILKNRKSIIGIKKVNEDALNERIVIQKPELKPIEDKKAKWALKLAEINGEISDLSDRIENIKTGGMLAKSELKFAKEKRRFARPEKDIPILEKHIADNEKYLKAEEKKLAELTQKHDELFAQRPY